MLQERLRRQPPINKVCRKGPGDLSGHKIKHEPAMFPYSRGGQWLPLLRL